MQRVHSICSTGLFVLLSVSPLFAQFRMADSNKDRWAGDDKVAHVFGNYAAMDIARQFLTTKESVPFILSAGVLWEIKDGLLPYEKYGFWGGDGFSAKDLSLAPPALG